MQINRRNFLKQCGTLAAGGFVLSNRTLEIGIRSKQPNIVFIFIDDMGWTGTSFMGSRYYETPRIDKLASEGMIFSNAYSAAPNCAPTRACLMSGQYTPRHGVFTVGSSERGDTRLRRLIPIPNTTTLDPAIVTFPEAIKTAGYVSACIGKWHLGNNSPYSPTDQGFEVSVARGDLDSDPDDPKRIYGLTAEAVKFIEANKDRPFFLYMSHHTVHTPIEARAELISKYEDKPPWDGHNNAKYAAMTEHTDEGVGILLDKLEDLKLAENTLVIFYSDNGGYGKQTSNQPLRGAKGMLYEGGIRVPMAVRWPRIVKGGTRCDVPVTSIDFYPTLLELTGAPKLRNHTLDGESFVPLLKGRKQLKRESIFWHCPVYLQGDNYDGARDAHFRTRPVGVVRKGKWKLLQYFEEWILDGGWDSVETNNAIELYDLENDIGETSNLANVNTVKRDELLNELIKWQNSIGAPVPTEPNPDYTG